MICHWHNCIRPSSISVGLPFLRLLFTVHSFPDGKVILSIEHRQTCLAKLCRGKRERKGKCEQTFSRAVSQRNKENWGTGTWMRETEYFTKLNIQNVAKMYIGIIIKKKIITLKQICTPTLKGTFYNP